MIKFMKKPYNQSFQILLLLLIVIIISITVNTTVLANETSTPTLEVDPGAGCMGIPIILKGFNFSPNTDVTNISIGDIELASEGNFNTTFRVPGLATGAQIISVTIGGTTTTTYFTVTAPACTISCRVASIDDKFIRMWAWNSLDGWLMYDPYDHKGSDLTLCLLDLSDGYLIKVSESCTLIYAGSSWDLNKGWNWIIW